MHKAFLSDLALRIISSKSLKPEIVRGWAYTPADFDFRGHVSHINRDAAGPDVLFVGQRGDSLAERLHYLFGWAHEHGFQRTIIMASDSPHLAPQTLNNGFEALQSFDLVLGRVLDGGYYLVGLSTQSDLLLHVPMSTSNAADALVATARARGMTVAELTATVDVDIEADIDILVQILEPDGREAPETWQALQELGLSDPAGRKASLLP
ncbi:hypothetical protein BH23CHL5_BH23CHL5_18110 [soil metagenome]